MTALRGNPSSGAMVSPVETGPDGLLEIIRAARPALGLMASSVTSDVREETLLRLRADNTMTGLCGHVDLGTGIRTALAQIIADEMGMAFDQVTMVLGHTRLTPDQGATIASETIQVSAVPLRRAAAQARQVILSRAARHLNCAPGELDIVAGRIMRAEVDTALTCGMMVAGERLRMMLDDEVALKQPSAYRIVGRPVARVDIPDKATGRMVYVHDVRVPGMLHARMVRPPYGGFDTGPMVGHTLRGVDLQSVAGMPGLVRVVVEGDFIGVVAEREEQAMAIAAALKVDWAPFTLPDLSDVRRALLDNPDTPRRTLDRGDVDLALECADRRIGHDYLWSYQMHASIGPSCAVAQCGADGVTVWSGTQNPHALRPVLAQMAGLEVDDITIIRHEAAGCYGRNCADDVCADALVLSQAVGGRPVRVQLTREQEHVWEPKGAAQLMQVRGGIMADGTPAGYVFATRYPSNVSPMLALALTGRIDATIGSVTQMGDRTCVPPYDYADARVTVHDMPPIARASWFRGVSAMPNSFAHDCHIDELSVMAGVDPLDYRLRHLPDTRAADLLRALARRAGWQGRTRLPQPDPHARVLRGRGVGYARYVHGQFPGVGAAWAAWIVDVAVDRATGLVRVTRVFVGQDSGMIVNPAGVRHQIHGNVIQSISRVLKEQVRFGDDGVQSRDWGTYPLLTFPEIPDIDIMLMDRQDCPPLGVGESASVPSAAAIANAIFDATGVRLRQVPFDPQALHATLERTLGPWREPHLPPVPAPQPMPVQAMGYRRRQGLLAAIGVACIAMTQAVVSLMPGRAIAPVREIDLSSVSADMLERGRQVAAAGDCVVCHTAPGGAPNTGGLALETPFGTIMTTNITPDWQTGIGGWSYGAFERAMRHGIGRDGRHLYPAFPYTSFTRMTDTDMQALYAYLMSRDPVSHAVPATQLSFPYSMRALMAGWNLLYHTPDAFRPDPARSEQWNRGAYLVEGAGHCGACHTPRNVMGAERWRDAWLAGGEADGWEAPALGARSRAPVAWTRDDLYAYLRTGTSARHGPAGGPMRPVIEEMRHLPDADIDAIATYLSTVGANTGRQAESAGSLSANATVRLDATHDINPGARMFGGSCAACHAGTAGHVFGMRTDLALNSNIFSARPDNLVNVIMEGVARPVSAGVAMPAFRHVLTARQLTELVDYIRATFAPGEPPWPDVQAVVDRRLHHAGP